MGIANEYINRGTAIDAVTAEALERNLDSLMTDDASQYHRAAARVLAGIPAADVRPVVTCGKCKYGKYTGTEWFCDKHSGHADKFVEDASYHEYHSKHWFCADGEERKHD